MPLLKLDKVSLNFGTQVILDEVEFNIRAGNRIGLLGRNGAGKTTLMKVINAEIVAESGERWVRPGTKITYLEIKLKSAISENFSVNSINQIRDNINYMKDRKNELIKVRNRLEDLRSRL